METVWASSIRHIQYIILVLVICADLLSTSIEGCKNQNNFFCTRIYESSGWKGPNLNAASAALNSQTNFETKYTINNRKTLK